MDALPFALVERIVHLLGSVAAGSTGLNQRRCALMDGLCRLVNADVWVWLQSRYDPQQRFATAFHTLDGGWSDEAERSAFFSTLHDPRVSRVIHSAFNGRDHETLSGDRIFSDADPGDGTLLKRWEDSTGLAGCLISFYPVSATNFNGIGLHRRRGKLPFTGMEQAVVHLIISEVGWLHRDGLNIAANDDRLLLLSTRARSPSVSAGRRFPQADRIADAPEPSHDRRPHEIDLQAVQGKQPGGVAGAVYAEIIYRGPVSFIWKATASRNSL